MEITKISGEKELFDRNKFCESLKSAGAARELVEETCSLIEKGITPEIATSEIFRKATEFLMKKDLCTACRYNLKRGIFSLGPAGFHFEQFIEVILQTLNYETKRNQIIAGECVEHEVDILAKNTNEKYFIEAKFHNKRGTKSHIDDVMYAEGRLEDVSRGRKESGHVLWLITNTKFTSKTKKYAKCRDIKLTGWRYPKDESLEELVTKHKLYPITALPSVGSFEQKQFAASNVMLAADVAPFGGEELSKKFGLGSGVADRIALEAHALVFGKSS